MPSLQGASPCRRSLTTEPTRVGAVGAHYREGAGQNEHRLPGARNVGLQQHTSSRTRPLPPTAFYRGGIGTRTCGACEPLGLLEPDAGKACTSGCMSRAWLC